MQQWNPLTLEQLVNPEENYKCIYVGSTVIKVLFIWNAFSKRCLGKEGEEPEWRGMSKRSEFEVDTRALS